MKRQKILKRRVEWGITENGKAQKIAIEQLECGHVKVCRASDENLKAETRMCFKPHGVLSSEGLRRLKKHGKKP